MIRRKPGVEGLAYKLPADKIAWHQILERDRTGVADS